MLSLAFQSRISLVKGNAVFQMACFRYFPSRNAYLSEISAEHVPSHRFVLTYAAYLSPAGRTNKQYLSPYLIFFREEKI